MELEPESVPRLIAQRALKHPDSVALAGAAGETMTYGELERASAVLAGEFRSLGVGGDSAVGVMFDRGPEMVVAALATMKAGGAYVPLDPVQPSSRLEFAVENSAARLLATTSNYASKVKARTPVVLCDCVARDANSTWPIDCRPDDLAYVIYTSGSTGEPKGVEVPHRGLSNLVTWHNSEYGIQAIDRATQVANIGFDAAVWEVWPYLAAGASVWFVPEDTVRQPSALQQFLVSRRITAAYVPTAVAEALITMQWPADTALRVLLTGGDVLQSFPVRGLPFSVANNYGPTECSVVATSGPVPPDSAALGRPSIGRPIRNTTIHLLDETMLPVPQGKPGEIYIGGESVARGYRNRPDLTAARFVPDPFSPEGERLYRTGDIARQLQDGTYEFIGRVDDQIKVRGYRIEPNEVAAAVSRHPNVQASAVACHTTPTGDKQLVAYVVPVAGARLTHSDLSACAAATLPAYMAPSVFVRLDSLPLTDRGKVDRNALPPPDRGNTIWDDDQSAAPATAVQDRLERIIADLLHLPEVDAGDNFFMLGGHSLLGAQLLVGIQKAFGVQLTLRQLFEAPTPASLARCIEGATGQVSSSEAAA